MSHDGQNECLATCGQPPSLGRRTGRERATSSGGRASRRLGLMLAAVTLGVVAGACGGSGSSHTAAQDATAACQALARSRGQVSSLSLSAGYRITGAANLGVAAAGEDNKKYGNLSQAMKSVQNDVSNNATGTISKDVNSALAACKADKLPSK